ncbi:MAG TPA: chemotaxis protein CheW [Phenylobacterium sp.]|nr:chemotaxis protein CheW [Phenylobacterium sp.]
MKDPKRPARKARPAPSGMSSSARRILQERTQRLAQAAQAPAATARGEPWLLCPLGDNLYVLPLRELERVRPLDRMTPLGAASGEVAGLVAEGGKIKQVLDFARLLGARRPPVDHGYLAAPVAHPDIVLWLGERPLAIEAETADSGKVRVLTSGPYAGRTAAVLSLAELLRTTAPTGA